MRMKLLMFAAAIALVATSCSKYRYESVAGDPLNTRIYTLDNGLKVYMTVNDEAPRLQTYIAVKVGAKNDPEETTGLAHYFEHLMFKGTDKFGTQNYEAEKPLLDEIERLFEVYRTKTDPDERKALYAQIDSVSQEASKLAIPNEYDKLMAAISADGTNAWTSFDETVYTEDIPSNRIEEWAKIQSDRFKNAVIRGFHTELETVYEEYNMSLTSDGNKAYYGMLSLLYPNHPSGRHTVLGYQDHLKNPSITNIKRYYETYYVPNNMAICLSGDFDPDEMIATIDKYFGDMQPNPALPEYEAPAEDPIAEVRTKTVYGNEAEFVMMGWPCGGIGSDDADVAEIAGNVLSNGKCGLIDIDINQQQKAQSVYAYPMIGVDYGGIWIEGVPREGQTLDEVKALTLAEIDKLRKGDFDESIIDATIANHKRRIMQRLDSNTGRAQAYVESFIGGTDWADEVARIDRLSRITKADVVAWAQKTLGDGNYAVLYKLQGEDPDQKKIEKPQITPIATNRDAVSDFLAEVQASEAKPIEPVFVDYDKDLTVFEQDGMNILYKKNETNGLFFMSWIYDLGANDDPALSMALQQYWSYLGTDAKSAEQIQTELYALACDMRVSVQPQMLQLSISGLAENEDKALALVEDYIANVKGDDAVLAQLKSDILKARADDKLSQAANFSALRQFTAYGEEAVKARTMSNDAVRTVTSDELTDRIHGLAEYAHRIAYYGPSDLDRLRDELKDHSFGAEKLTAKEYPMQLTPENKVILAQYDAKQIYYYQFSNRGEMFDVANDPAMQLYNGYFGGGMNSIVFQEMREARALAYSADAYLSTGVKRNDPYTFSAFIATQNDKMQQAVEAFEQIINDMPESQAAFELAKQSLLGSIETSRTIKNQVLNSYLSNVIYKGVKEDRNKAIYEQVKNMTLEDVKAYQQKWVKNRTYTYSILGDKNDIDMDYLRTLGPVTEVTQEQIFGY